MKKLTAYELLKSDGKEEHVCESERKLFTRHNPFNAPQDSCLTGDALPLRFQSKHSKLHVLTQKKTYV